VSPAAAVAANGSLSFRRLRAFVISLASSLPLPVSRSAQPRTSPSRLPSVFSQLTSGPNDQLPPSPRAPSASPPLPFPVRCQLPPARCPLPAVPCSSVRPALCAWRFALCVCCQLLAAPCSASRLATTLCLC